MSLLWRGQEQQAQAQLDTAQAQLSDRKAQVEADVRDALLDIASAQKLVEVARSSVDLGQRGPERSTGALCQRVSRQPGGEPGAAVCGPGR